MEMRVSSYRSRAELDRYCELLDPEKRNEAEIVGTRSELKRYGLSETTTIHNISCRATDSDGVVAVNAASTKVSTRLPKAKGHGLNGQLSNLPKKS